MAEDEEDTASLIKCLLEATGSFTPKTVDVCRNEWMILPPPGIVLLDVMLPFASGLVLLGHIRRKPDPK